MRSNISSFIVIAVIVALGVFLMLSGNGTSSASKTQSVARLTVAPFFYDFGTIDIYNGTVTTTFLITNEGEEDVTIIGGTTTCGCTSAEIDNVPFGMHEPMKRDVVILAGETKNLTVIYDPLAHGPSGVGLAERTVFLKTNSTVTPELEVRIRALVINNR
ncbi:DUF1573 domain-containing protein [Candidatus Kaiserbacteria bacterium]|nr:DUF1573 domain-containing protein [Candidatus Kaiserbacteria bacterium]